MFYLTLAGNVLKKIAARRVLDSNNEVFVHPYNAIRQGSIRQWIKKYLFPYYFKYYRAPTERSSHAHYIMYARHKGLLADDNRQGSVELFARAYEIAPLKLKQEREKRICLSNWLHQTRQELHPEEQNFDPFLPYMAPYVEETRFLMQEEEELLLYHQFHRKLYKGGFSGFGEKQRDSKSTEPSTGYRYINRNLTRIERKIITKDLVTVVKIEGLAYSYCEQSNLR